MHPFEVVERNLRHSMRFFSLAKQGGEVREMPGVSIVCSGVNYSVFNAALLSAPVAGNDGGLEGRIAIPTEHFGALGLRWSYWVCQDLLDEPTRGRAKEVFSRNGLRSVADQPGMLAERLLPPRRKLPSLEIRRVADAQTRLDFCHISSVVFELPFAISQEVYGSEPVWHSDFIGYVGYVDATAVATAATVAAAGAVGVYSVATLPAHRGHGYAESIVRHALETARDASGIERTVLQSTRAGLPLYRRLGYQQVTRVSIYVMD